MNKNKKMKIKDIEFSGERVYPENYYRLRPLLYYHLARYAFAKSLLRRGDKVVDAACGTGYGTYELASVADSVIGVDISPDAIQYAEKNFSTGNIRFKIGNVKELSSLIAEPIDAVVSFETIEHLSDEDQNIFLSSISNILAPSGILVISTPNTLIYSGGKKTENPHHLCEMTLAQFKCKLGKKFSVVQLFGQRKFEGSRVKGLMFMIGNILVNCFNAEFSRIKFNGDIAQQVGDFEFPSHGIENCQYIIAVCKKPIADDANAGIN